MLTLTERLDDIPNLAALRTSVADQVNQSMLKAIVDGEITSGEILNDQDWSDLLGVSRTPVREAIQRLRELGLLDIAPARYTRLLSFTPETARQEAQDWGVLHRAVIDTLIPIVTPTLISDLNGARQRYQKQLDEGVDAYATNFEFFSILRDATPSYSLRLGATASAYRLCLANAKLQNHPPALVTLHDAVISSLKNHKPKPAHHALTHWTHAHTVS